MKILFATIAALSLSACAPNYSNGERVGVITKLSHKGIFWKSWEGSMNQGGTKEVSDGNGNVSAVPNAFDFNVEDPAVIEKLKQAAKSGERVEVSYRQWFITPPNINNSYVIVDVKPTN